MLPNFYFSTRYLIIATTFEFNNKKRSLEIKTQAEMKCVCFSDCSAPHNCLTSSCHQTFKPFTWHFNKLSSETFKLLIIIAQSIFNLVNLVQLGLLKSSQSQCWWGWLSQVGQLLTGLDKPVAQKSFMQAEEKGKQGLWWGNIVWDRASKKSSQKLNEQGSQPTWERLTAEKEVGLGHLRH